MVDDKEISSPSPAQINGMAIESDTNEPPTPAQINGLQSAPEPEPEQQPEPESQPETRYQDSPQAENFKRLREAKERAERERDEAIRIVQSLKQPDTAQETSVNIGDDDYVEGKHLKRELQQVRKQLSEITQNATQIAVEAKLKTNYPDFDSVVNTENINRLRDQYPEVAETIMSNNNLYSKAVSAYTMIKNLGMAPDKPSKYEAERVNKNIAKPRPVTSLSPQQGDSPLSRVNAFAQGGELSKDLKESLYKEMMAAKKKM